MLVRRRPKRTRHSSDAAAAAPLPAAAPCEVVAAVGCVSLCDAAGARPQPRRNCLERRSGKKWSRGPTGRCHCASCFPLPFSSEYDAFASFLTASCMRGKRHNRFNERIAVRQPVCHQRFSPPIPREVPAGLKQLCSLRRRPVRIPCCMCACALVCVCVRACVCLRVPFFVYVGRSRQGCQKTVRASQQATFVFKLLCMRVRSSTRVTCCCH